MGKNIKLISPNGEKCEVEPGELPPTDDFVGPVAQSKVMFGCGHEGPEVYAMRLNGDTVYLTAEQMAGRELCGDCLTAAIAKATIRCALCGWRIHNDMSVALYELGDGFRDDATRVEFGEKTCVIGCPRCMPSEDFIVGIWSGGRFFSNEEVKNTLQEVAQAMGIEDGEDDPKKRGREDSGRAREKKGDC